MRKKMKPFLSLFLTLTLVLSPLSSAGVFAAETEAYSDAVDTSEAIVANDEAETLPTPTVEENEENKASEEKKEEDNQVSSDLENEEEDGYTPPENEGNEADSSEELTETDVDTVDSSQMTTDEMSLASIPVLLSDDDVENAGNNAANIHVLKEDGTEYAMFKIVDSAAVLQGDQIAITITTNNTSYSKLYFGSPSNTEKSPVWSGTQNQNGGWTFTFTIDAIKGGTNVPVALYAANKGTWSSTVLTMTIPDMGYVAPEPGESDPDAPGEEENPPVTEKEDEIKAIYANDEANGTKAGNDYTMFKIAKSTAKVNGDQIEITLSVSPAASGSFTYDAIYIGSKDDEVKEPLVMGVANEETGLQDYTFILPLSAQGTEVTFVPRSASKGTFSTSSVLALTIPDFGAKTDTDDPGEEENPDQDPDPFDSEITSLEVVKDSDGAAFTMFKVTEYSLLNDGENLTITLSTTSKSFNKLYFGSIEDNPKTPVITGTSYNETGWTFTFTLPASLKNTRIPVLLGYVDESKGTDGWYVNSTGAYSLYLAIPDVEVSGQTPEPAPEADIDYKTGGSNLTIKDITILSSTAALSADGTQVNCTVSLAGTDYDRIYFGDRMDTTKEPVVYGVSDGANMIFTYSVPADKQGMYILFTPGKSNGSWYTTQDLFISVPNINRTFDLDSYQDGIYNIYGNATTYNHIGQSGANPIDKGSTLTIQGDTIVLTWITRSNVDKIYIGDVADSEEQKEANAIYGTKVDESDPFSYTKFVVVLPKAAIGGMVPYVQHTTASGWSTKQYQLSIGEFIEYVGEAEEPEEPDPTPSPDPTPDTSLEDGIYNVPMVETGELMFRVVNCQLTSKNGELVAQIALSGTGYDYLYMGTKEEAYVAEPSEWIPYTVKNVLNNETGEIESKYVYEIPVSNLDTPIKVASRSAKYVSQGKGEDAWINRTITISSEGIQKTGDLPTEPENPDPTPTDPTPIIPPVIDPGNNGETTKPSGNDGKADEESKYESDLSGSTSAVDSSTGLPDGVYTPDSFSWSGGTGRVKISCNKITVKNGQAYATIVFSSSSYAYVKANGRTYYGTVSGGSTSFTIPVALNKNNKILGMTTKMTAAHEIEYNIYVYLAAAAKADGTGNGTNSDVVIGVGQSNNDKLDEEAPQIIGLTYESETKLEYAQYFKIYNYQDGITLIEIDMTSDTALDPDKSEADDKDDVEDEEKTENTEEADNSIETEEDTTELTETDEEKVAELYMGNVVKYLIVPEGTEIPVGLEKEVIIVDLPVDKTYVASEEALDTMDELELLDTIRALGFEKDDCSNEEVSKAMENGDISFAGTFDEIDYKALLRAQCNLSILPSELLPREEKDTEEQEMTKKEDTEDTEEQELSVEEQTDRLQEIAEHHAMLWIPMLVDRSSDEETELGQYEWIKLYGAIFQCEDETTKLFDQAVAAFEKEDN